MSTSPSSPSSNSSSSSDSHSHSSLHSTPSSFRSSVSSFFRSKKLLTHLVLLGFSLVVFCIALLFAVEHWRHEELSSSLRWTSHSCNVTSKLLQPNPSNSSQFRITAQVTILHLSSRPVTAYYGSTTDYNLTRSQAQNAFANIQTNSTCYVSNEPHPQVSLLSINTSKSSSASVYIAWSTTFIAAVMAIIQITFLSHVFHKCTSSQLSISSPQIAVPDQAKTPILTIKQTNFICSKYAHDLRLPDSSDWVCSICLEDHPPQSVIKSVQLPCKHIYHQRCIREWLSKGKGVCPLCNWDAKSLFGDVTGDSETQAEPIESQVEVEEVLPIGGGVGVARDTP